MLGIAVKAGPLLAVSALVAGLLSVAPPSAADPAPVRIMLVGDSITEGSSGDWTWRYRLAKYLDASDVSYELVGPRTAMLDLADNLHDSDEYVDPDFDQHHFARWGESLHAILDENAASPEDSIGWAVGTYQPDVVIEVLGTNDLLYGSAPQETVDTAHQFVSEVRAARPDTAVVLSTAPDVQYDHFSSFNDLLESQAPSWATPTAPVVVSDPSPGWSAAADTCDNTHPSAAGEVRIAAAQADALAVLGIGSPVPLPLPEPPPGPRRPAVLTGVAGDGHVSLSWDLPPGGTAVLISTRDVTAGQEWRRLPYPVGGTAWLSDGLTNGHTYEYRLNVLKHDCVAQDVDSDIVTVRPGPDTPGPVSGLTVDRLDHGFSATWQAGVGATSYVVWVRRSGSAAAWRTFPTSATSYQAGSLLAGARYDVAVEPIGRAGAGERSEQVSVKPTGVRPKAPVVSHLVVGRDGTGIVSWSAVRHATDFVIARRRHTPGARWVAAVEPTSQTTATISGLRSGRDYLFRVTAYDDLLRGGTSRVHAARVPRVAAVRHVTVRRSSPHRAATTGDVVPFATSYTLERAVAARCGRAPRARDFRISATGLTRPRLVIRPHRTAAVWVRWYAVRDGARGPTSAGSVACLRPPG